MVALNLLCFVLLLFKVKTTGHYNPFASYAHPPIVRDHVNVHEIGSHIPMVADRYPWISPSRGFDIAATGRKKMLFCI